MRSLLGHLGKDSFQTFRRFKLPLVCPLVGKKKEAGCILPAGCIARDSPCYLRKVTKAAVSVCQISPITNLIFATCSHTRAAPPC